ncbi:hypothetical protein BD309DRAFT_875435 [Dichomitus squalens]|uniref:Uncharacterized protein n=1 Tax=Dichomitus squalens TaxID=114155 RepID=A0A4Q9PWF6_9APHY|nr:hypothetical protein BD309DRAFT_875435 [Dichomitus squalens]TBU58921.1 hypothetical protein BD310DRAFT_818424 [Dichomitus squalens]
MASATLENSRSNVTARPRLALVRTSVARAHLVYALRGERSNELQLRLNDAHLVF